MEEKSEFFIEKAADYIQIIESLEKNRMETPSIEALLDFESTESEKYRQRERSVSEIKLKIKLLFAETKYNEIFKQALEEIDKENAWFCDSEQKLKKYKNVVELFINHTREFNVVG